MYIQLGQGLQKQYLGLITDRAEQSTLKAVRYLDLGTTVIRILCYTEDIIPVLEKQFTYVLRTTMEHYNSSIAVYKEQDAGSLAKSLYTVLPAQQKMKIKAEMMWLHAESPVIQAADKSGTDLLIVSGTDGITEAYEENSRTFYYGISNFDQEELVKSGHCFKQILFSLTKSETTMMTHGAVMGYHGKGFLLCGRGRRGKSTLTIQSMLHNFEYVSDDYQILKKTENGLFAYPVYSVVTLSHRMYNEMYDSFNGKFVCNNYEKDKYFFNIAAYHSQFRTAFPIRFCLFPEITADAGPSIQLCGPEEKGRAIVHILHSTASQMHVLNDAQGLSRLFHMIINLPFYKLRLCADIATNTEYLRSFVETTSIPDEDTRPLPHILRDISFGLATFLDTETFKFYIMNKFATNVYQLLCCDVPVEEIRQQLEKYQGCNPAIMKEFKALQVTIGLLNLYDKMDCANGYSSLQDSLAAKSGYHLSIFDYGETTPRELLCKKE